MNLFTRLIASTLLLSQLALSAGTFVLPAAAEGSPEKAGVLAPTPRLTGDKQKLSRPKGADTMLQNASGLRTSLTHSQRESLKEILERYAPQLKELDAEFGVSNQSSPTRPTRPPQQPREVPSRARLQEMVVRRQAIQAQIEAEFSAVLSAQQLQQYQGALRPTGTAVGSDSLSDPTTYYYCPISNAYLYSELAYMHAFTAYDLNSAISYTAADYAYSTFVNVFYAYYYPSSSSNPYTEYVSWAYYYSYYSYEASFYNYLYYPTGASVYEAYNYSAYTYWYLGGVIACWSGG